MEELIACIARSLVKKPEAVTVTKIQKKGLEVYQLHVAPEDMGKVIGKQGKIAKALRLVVTKKYQWISYRRNHGSDYVACTGDCQVQSYTGTERQNHQKC
jgi:predicted RNA-binding protein YlqC (UPF0109 family)